MKLTTLLVTFMSLSHVTSSPTSLAKGFASTPEAAILSKRSPPHGSPHESLKLDVSHAGTPDSHHESSLVAEHAQPKHFGGDVFVDKDVMENSVKYHCNAECAGRVPMSDHEEALRQTSHAETSGSRHEPSVAGHAESEHHGDARSFSWHWQPEHEEALRLEASHARTSGSQAPHTPRTSNRTPPEQSVID